MINLIPNEEKKIMTKDFFFRLAVVFFTVLGFSFWLVLFAVSPSYFLISFKENIINDNLKRQVNEPIPEVSQQTLALVEDLNFKFNFFENISNNKFVVSEKIINEIVLQKMSDIKITQISYENTVTTGKKISIRGTAPSRERLLKFRLALEDNIAFQKVDLPISNFVKGSNIQFFLTLIPS